MLWGAGGGDEGVGGWFTPKNCGGEMPLVLSKGTSNHTETNNNKMDTRNEKAHLKSTSFDKNSGIYNVCILFQKTVI